MLRVEEKMITDDESNHLRSQIVMSNDNLNLKTQFAISSLSEMRREPYTFAEPHIGCVQNNSPEFEGIKGQAGLNSFILTPKQWIEKSQQSVGQISSQNILQSEKPIAQQDVSQFETKVRQQAVAQLTQIPLGTQLSRAEELQ